jgi:23S rRNA (guanosine2251-2'-O)-methyltransferase
MKPEKLLVLARERRGKEANILTPFREAGWKIEEVERAKLDLAAEALHHQGFVALIRHFPYRTTAELIEQAQAQSDPLIIALDEVQDAGNLGAILRSAECAGVVGGVIPVHRAAGITAAVIRASAGAALHLPLARAVNLAHALEEFTVAGFRVFGADQEGMQSLYKTDLTGPVVIVVGSEGRGLRPGVKRRCEALISIPIRGRTASLNASVAAALCLYEALRQRQV